MGTKKFYRDRKKTKKINKRKKTKKLIKNKRTKKQKISFYQMQS